LSFVKKLEGGMTHVQDQCPTSIVIPDCGGFKSESLAIELYGSFVITGCESEAQFKDGTVWVGCGHINCDPFVN
jgi:hypothetical protein